MAQLKNVRSIIVTMYDNKGEITSFPINDVQEYTITRDTLEIKHLYKGDLLDVFIYLKDVLCFDVMISFYNLENYQDMKGGDA